MLNIRKIKTINIFYIFLFLYLIAISAYQLGTGFDAIFVRTTFVLLVAITIILGKKIVITKQIKWCVVFWGFYFLSVIWAKNPNDTMYYVNNFIQILGIFICFPIMIKDEKSINTTLKLIIGSLLYTCVLLVIRTPQSEWGTERIGEAIGLNPNGLGMRLAIGFIACIYFLHYKTSNDTNQRSKMALIFYSISAIIFIVVAMFTGSKKALLMIILGFVSYELIISKGWKIFLKSLIIVVFLCFMTYLIFNNEMLYTVIGRRIEKTILTLQGTTISRDVDGSLEERAFFIEKAIDLFKDYPILGYGGNNFVTYMREISYSHIAYSHNNYVELLSTLGIIGFTIYYYMWGKTLITLSIDYLRNKSGQTLFFLITIFILLILDYANVSYISEFNIILLALAGSIKKKCNKDNNFLRD